MFEKCSEFLSLNLLEFQQLTCKSSRTCEILGIGSFLDVLSREILKTAFRPEVRSPFCFKNGRHGKRNKFCNINYLSIVIVSSRIDI